MSQNVEYVCDICNNKSKTEMSHGPIRMSLQFGSDSQKHINNLTSYEHICEDCKNQITEDWKAIEIKYFNITK